MFLTLLQSQGGFAPVVVQETPQSGGARRRTRFITQFKRELYEFPTVTDLEEFVAQIVAEKRVSKKKLHKEVKIRVEPGVQSALYKYDLPDIQPIAQRFDFKALEAILEKYDRLATEETSRLIGMAMAEADDEEVLLLL